jgi:mono/diheme cytochrome c family protein
LEGLGALKVGLVQKLLKDPNPRIRIQAIRASETLYKAGEKSLEAEYAQLLNDPDTNVLIQAMMTAKFLNLPDIQNGIKAAMERNKAAGVKLVGMQIIDPPKPGNMGPFGGASLNKDQQASIDRGAVIYNELCSQCHGNNGQGTPAGGGKLIAPALAGSLRVQSHPEYAVRVVLHGMEGLIDGKAYAGGMMTPMKEHTDEWVADVISYIRNGLSNDASLITPQQVAKIRAKTAEQKNMYQYEKLLKIVPQELPVQEGWKITASHTSSTRIGGNVSPQSAFTYEGWSTGGRQTKGMWYQIEFPKEVSLTELQFIAPATIKRGWQRNPNAPRTPPPMVQTYPRAYSVETSSDGKNWQETYAEIKGTDGENAISFANTKAKFLRLKLNDDLAKDSEDIPWSMRQLKIFVQN